MSMVSHLKARSPKGRRAQARFFAEVVAMVEEGFTHSKFYGLDALENAFLQTFRQRRIIQGGGHVFAFS